MSTSCSLFYISLQYTVPVCTWYVRIHTYRSVCVCINLFIHLNAITIFTVRRLCRLSVCLLLIRSFSRKKCLMTHRWELSNFRPTRSKVFKIKRLLEFLFVISLFLIGKRGDKWKVCPPSQNEFMFTQTEILEKLPSSLCLNPRVCEFLTCPSSCDGSRQSGGCVDVAWECVRRWKSHNWWKGKKKHV